ncbi:hypothetical protein Syun_013152 [Stephania yunnanensis]|uniref:Uncharacterized protein n=1 Tax=Stephania yunnanensis TaxID=152371 RepID=A0AAP0PH23_9MAGN
MAHMKLICDRITSPRFGNLTGLESESLLINDPSMASLLPIYLILASLSPISTYASVSYRKGLRTKDDNNQEFIEQVRRAHQFLRVDPSRVVQLSWHPRVFLYRGFLSDEECDHLISLARGEPEKKPLQKDHESGSTADSVTALSKGKDEIVGGWRSEFLDGPSFQKRTARVCRFCIMDLNRVINILVTMATSLGNL